MRYNYTKDETLLEVKDLSLTIEGNEILHNINFKVQDIHIEGNIQGQVLSFVGKSGIGKCVSEKTKITIRTKITNKIEEVTFEDLYKKFI